MQAMHVVCGGEKQVAYSSECQSGVLKCLAGAVGGFFDGHPLVNWRHENLMRLFFRALRAYVKPGGVVKAPWQV